MNGAIVARIKSFIKVFVPQNTGVQMAQRTHRAALFVHEIRPTLVIIFKVIRAVIAETRIIMIPQRRHNRHTLIAVICAIVTFMLAEIILVIRIVLRKIRGAAPFPDEISHHQYKSLYAMTGNIPHFIHYFFERLILLRCISMSI